MLLAIQKYEPTTEDLERWEKLDELGMTAMCGTPMSDEEYKHRLQSVIDGSCFAKYLDKVSTPAPRVLR